MWQRRGSPRTTIRSTRRPTRSGSRSRKASRLSATERSRAARRATDGRRGRGTRGSPWRPTSPPRRSASSISGRTGAVASVSGTPSTPTCSSARLHEPESSLRSLQQGEPSYKRLARVLSVPAAGATVSFAITRETEPGWDFVFVEAHTVGEDDWTTLPDLNGHTSQDTGFSCPLWHGLHPFLTHYQTDSGDGTCSSGGSSRTWWAASGPSGGWAGVGRRSVAVRGSRGRGLDQLRER